MSDAAEEKRQAAVAAASKKQTKGNKKKGKDDDNATPALDEPRMGRSSQLTSKGGEDDYDGNYDLYLPKEFSMALKQKFGRKFTFGPITFNDLDKEFDGEAARKKVIESLEKSGPM